MANTSTQEISRLFQLKKLASKETSANGKYFNNTMQFLLVGWAPPTIGVIPANCWWAMPTLLKDAEFSLEVKKFWVN